MLKVIQASNCSIQYLLQYLVLSIDMSLDISIQHTLGRISEPILSKVVPVVSSTRGGHCIVYSAYYVVSLSWFCDHRACISLGERIGTDTGCAGCRQVERTVLMSRTHKEKPWLRKDYLVEILQLLIVPV